MATDLQTEVPSAPVSSSARHSSISSLDGRDNGATSSGRGSAGINATRIIGLSPPALPRISGMRIEAEVYGLVGDLLDREQSVIEPGLSDLQSFAQARVDADNLLLTKDGVFTTMFGQQLWDSGKEREQVSFDLHFQLVVHSPYPSNAYPTRPGK